MALAYSHNIRQKTVILNPVTKTNIFKLLFACLIQILKFEGGFYLCVES